MRRSSRPSVRPLLVAAIATAAFGCPSTGLRALRACALAGDASPPWEGYPFAAGCEGAVDFGTLAIGVPARELLAIHHSGRGDPLTVQSVDIVGISGQAATFSLSFFLATGGGAPAAAGLPLTLDPPDEDTGVPPQVLYVQIDFDGTANPFPVDQLSITSDDESNPTRLVDLLGALSECEAGLLDCDGDPGNGCEVDVSDPTTCGATCAALVDCALEPSADSDGAGDAYEMPGEVTDFTGCGAGGCTSDTFADACNGTVLTEYAADGAAVTSTEFDCTDLETFYCQTGTELYRDVWSCSGTPGACIDEPDVLVTDCSAVSGCTGVCGSGLNGCAYSTGMCTAGTCSGGAADVDLDMVQCAGCSLNWAVGGEVAATACCGDDAGELLTACTDSSTNGVCGADTSACCGAAGSCVDHMGSCRTAASCHPFGAGGLDSYCNAGSWEDPDEDMGWCTATGCAYAWAPGGTVPGGSACCGDDAGETLGACTDSSANGTCGADTSACCASAAECVDAAGACRASSECFPFGSSGLDSYCNAGTWEDPDESMTYCTATGCGNNWSAGGDVAATACCGDDTGESYRTCTDSSTNGNCGTDTAACCAAGTACVDDSGNCQPTGACALFGSAGKDSYCNAGSWDDPDESMAYCTATGCGYGWVAGSTGTNASCCGDDAGEDFEGTSSCCYNAGLLADGATSLGMLCSNGTLQECAVDTGDDSGLGTVQPVNTPLEGNRCTAMNSWCPNGMTDCSAPAGCETNLNAGPACSGATGLGGIVASPSICPACGCIPAPCAPYSVTTGLGEAWRTFVVTSASDACGPATEIDVTLAVPPDVDYDLYLYTTACGGSAVASSTSVGMGTDEVVSHTGVAGFVYYVEIRFVAGVSCTSWTLNVFGGNCI